MEMEWEQLEALLDRFGQTDILELELETEKLKIRLKKNQKAGEGSILLPEGEERKEAKVLPKAAMEAVGEAAGEAESAGEKEGGRAVKAPLVGTFYAAAEPGADPYVREGQEVKKGDVIGLIEAMKIMNEIPAPCDGRVTKILAENGSFVAYDEVLLYIEE